MSAVATYANDPHEPPVIRDARRSAVRSGGFVAGCAAVGAFLIVVAFHEAARASGDQFTLFWVGYLLGLLPPIWHLARPTSPLAPHRVQLLAAIGSFTLIPKALRTFTGPLFSDEFAHYRQTAHLISTGHIDPNAPLIIALPSFPGLHSLTASIAVLGHLPVWPVALVVIATSHLLTLFGIASLIDGADPRRIGALAAALYATCPSWLFFHTEFAYETLAFPLMIWTLVVATRTMTGALSHARGLLLTALLGAALVVTHHITSYFTLVVLAALAVVIWRRRRSDEAPRVAVAAFAIVFAEVGLWTSLHAQLLALYLAPSLPAPIRHWLWLVFHGQAPALPSPATLWHNLTHAGGGGHTGSSGGHKPFAGAHIPVYEIIAGYLLPLTIGCLALAIAVITVRRRRNDPRTPLRLRSAPSLAWVLVGVGLLYFPSVLLILSPAQNEGARRSWAWSWLGLAYVGAVAISWALTRTRVSLQSRPPVRLAIVSAVITVVLVGSVAVGQDEAYRFPAPYRVGSDTLSQSDEGRALNNWMLTTLGPGHRVFANRYDTLGLGSIADQSMFRPSTGFPIWDLFLSTDDITPSLIRQLKIAKAEYLVVDKRMAEAAPAQGVWFVPNEPRIGPTQQLDAAALSRFRCLPWTHAVYASDHYEVYRFDLANFGQPAGKGC